MTIVKSRPTRLNHHEERLVNVMQLLGDTTRFKIFKVLRSDRELCVTEIAERLGISVSAVSQHFRIFELVGLVDKARNGQKICYTLKTDDQFVQSIISIISK